MLRRQDGWFEKQEEEGEEELPSTMIRNAGAQQVHPLRELGVLADAQIPSRTLDLQEVRW